jgi:AcrR family transcriptional regulator
MGYSKGKISREQIIDACSDVVLARGFAATTTAELLQAAQTSAGKLTHHFPTKESLFEATFDRLMQGFEAGPFAILRDRQRTPGKRITDFLDAMYQLYAHQRGPIGCPIGHAAVDSNNVPASMKEQAFRLLDHTRALLESAFLELKEAPAVARAKATLFVSSWQGAIVVCRAGGGLPHIRSVFRHLKILVESEAKVR